MNMVDFQNGNLSDKVFELITRVNDLTFGNEYPNFVTKQYNDGKWKCELAIPGVLKVAHGYDETETGSINKCAALMMYYIDKYHDKNQYNPGCSKSIFLGNIEQFFDNVEYDKDYKYRLFESDILIDNNDVYLKELLKKYASDTIRKLNIGGEEVDQISQIVTIRLLVKKKEK